MKRIIVAILFFLAAHLRAQPNPSIIYILSASSLPSTCTGYVTWEVVGTPTLLGTIYTCVSGVPTAVSSSGGSGLIYTSPTLNCVPRVSNATSPGTVIDSAICDSGIIVSSSRPVAVTGNLSVTGTGTFGAGYPSQFSYTSLTVSQLPSASGSTCGGATGPLSGTASCVGYGFLVRDGLTSIDCITGGGTAQLHLCYAPTSAGWVSGGSVSFVTLSGDVTSTSSGGASTVIQIEGAAIPVSSNLVGTNSSKQVINEYTAVGAVTWNNAGTCTFAAASGFIAFGTLTTVSGQSCTLSPTGLLAGGSYTLKVVNAASTAATLTLGTAGSCSAWKVINGGAGAITLSGASKNDVLAFTFDGTNCILTFGTNFS